MNPTLYEALSLALRWTHVLTAVLWVGQTFLFSWLDSRLHQRGGDGGAADGVWMVHSGGFYRVEKVARPRPLPDPLHWTRWESLLTWVTGLALLLHLYTFGGLLLAPGSTTSHGAAVTVSLTAIVGGWALYETIWSSPLRRREALATLLSFLLLVGLGWMLAQLLTPRAAWFHVGATMGTVMTANVWLRILPPQRRMVATVAADGDLDPSWGDGAKQRSRHNTFIVFPLLLIMLSNHFPSLSYGHRYAWALLGGWVLIGWAIRRAMIARGH